MEDAVVEAIKGRLDAELVGKPETLGIAFGPLLFAAFDSRGYLTTEQFGVLAEHFQLDRAPAYQKTHIAFIDLELPDDGFRIGSVGDQDATRFLKKGITSST
jgi:hypothetical protein